ncbi:MAG: hypothetical protein E6R03_17825 [Hyphomicrobiaceae bacterium]|nr:MAG: hypothetical protein E6R03_17825 [Hyphomicrobiaceae bacterium]
MRNSDGEKVIVRTGEVFVEDDIVINRLQPPGSPIKFQQIGSVEPQPEEEEEPVAVGNPAQPLPTEQKTQATQDDQNDQRATLEAMTFEEVKAYALNNLIDISAARSKKSAIDTIMQALQE